MNIYDHTKNNLNYEIDGDVEEDTPRDVNEQTQTDKEYDI
jgi:hypothetical protein